MTIPTGDMLRRLGSGVRPGVTGSVAPDLPIDKQGFEDLLGAVQRSGGTGRPVRVDPSLLLEIDQAALDRLGPIVDAAEQAGARRLFAAVDDAGMTIDVASRTIEQVRSGDDDSLQTGIDAAVAISLPKPAADQEDGEGAEPARAQEIVRPASLAPLRSLGSIRNDSLARAVDAGQGMRTN
ncbi:MAG: hypothetical protein AAGD00_06260 [Planctomycetota bacterium]